MNRYAVYKLKYGYFRIEEEQGSVISIHHIDAPPPDMGTPTPLTDRAADQFAEYFAGRRREFEFPYELRGTEFQKKVWSELEKIAYGETRTYKDIASAVGNPKAARAVGMVCNRNPIIIAVPCHRVIGSDGRLTGYAAGISMKKALLSIEENHKEK